MVRAPLSGFQVALMPCICGALFGLHDDVEDGRDLKKFATFKTRPDVQPPKFVQSFLEGKYRKNLWFGEIL